MIINLLIVAFGSGVGGMLRYLASLLSRSYPALFPYWTFGVNILGGFLIGFFAASPGIASERSRLLLITGFCGGFTTFSAFSLETLLLLQQGREGWALANVLLSVVSSIGACWLGYLTGK